MKKQSVWIQMKRYVFGTIFATGLFGQLACATTTWNGKIVDTFSKSEVQASELLTAMGEAQIVVVGEKHYSSSVQQVEGELFKLFSSTKQGQKITFGWEFLAYTEESKNQPLWDEVVAGTRTINEYLTATQGNFGSSYAPIFQVALDSGHKVRGLNLTRAEKAPVVKSGISALDPKLLPAGYERLGSNYLERFEATMQGHVKPDQLDNYFEVQCLTDDVMASQALHNFEDGMFVIAGSFHVDYFDGTVARLIARDPSKKMLTVRVLDLSDYQESEIEDLVWHPKYGPIADYVWYVNEPSTQP
jgi:uncharacterized iron-regulated protein